MMQKTSHTHVDSHTLFFPNYLLPGKLFLALDRYVTPHTPTSTPSNPHSGYSWFILTHTHTHTWALLSDRHTGSRLQASCHLQYTDIPLPSPFHMTLPSSSPPYFTFSVPHFLPMLCFFFFSFSQLSHKEENTSVFASINSTMLFFYTPFKSANTSLIFSLNTLHSFCLYPPLCSLSLFPGVTLTRFVI